MATIGNDPNGQRCSERSPRSIIDVIHPTNPADDALSANPPLAAARRSIPRNGSVEKGFCRDSPHGSLIGDSRSEADGDDGETADAGIGDFE